MEKEVWSHTDTEREEGHVLMDAEIRLMLLEVKKSQELPANTRGSWHYGRILSSPYRGSRTLLTS
jgi:hypothetical protein